MKPAAAILVIGFLAFLVIALVVSAARRGWSGVITLLAVMAILSVLGAMLLPALASRQTQGATHQFGQQPQANRTGGAAFCRRQRRPPAAFV